MLEYFTINPEKSKESFLKYVLIFTLACGTIVQ